MVVVFQGANKHIKIMLAALQRERQIIKPGDPANRRLPLGALKEAQKVSQPGLGQRSAVGKEPLGINAPCVCHQRLVGTVNTDSLCELTKRYPLPFVSSVGSKPGFAGLPRITRQIVSSAHS